MAGYQLSKRITALEAKAGGGFKPYHRIIQEAGETEEQARTRWEAENGPLGDDPCIIWRVIVAPSKAMPPHASMQ